MSSMEKERTRPVTSATIEKANLNSAITPNGQCSCKVLHLLPLLAFPIPRTFWSLDFVRKSHSSSSNYCLPTNPLALVPTRTAPS